MASTPLRIRPATEADSRNLFDWRNDAQTRAVSISTAEISWPDHDRWFAASLTNAHRMIYIVEAPLNGAAFESIGMVRFDTDDEGRFAEVSINLNPDARGKGLGTPTLLAGIEQFERDHPELQGTTAQIRETNAPSIAIFSKASFASVRTVEGIGHYLRARSASTGKTRTDPN